MLKKVGMNIALLKIIIIGDKSVGKSSIIHRYHDRIFSQIPKPTYSNEIMERDFRTKGGTEFKVQILDTTVQETHDSLIDDYCRDVDGIFIVFAINDKTSFDNITNKWNSKLEFNINKNPIKVLLASKCDTNRVINENLGQALSKRIGAKYFETSAKENKNITQSYEYLINSIYERIKITKKGVVNLGLLCDEKINCCPIQ